MNIKSVLLFLIFTVVIHIGLIKINEIILENNQMKQNNKPQNKKNFIKNITNKKQKTKIPIDNKEPEEEEEEQEDIDKIINNDKEEISGISNNKIFPEDIDIINDEDLRSDLLDFISKSKKNSSIITSSDVKVSASNDNTKIPGYLNFGDEIERELKTSEYNLKTVGNDNITLKNSYNNEVQESTANQEFKMNQNTSWQYKNESIMNGGIDDGIGGFDPKSICNFAAITL